jgi:hypothetical protein
MALTLTEAQTQLDLWLTASRAVAEGQSYSISTGAGSRSLTLANVSEIRQMIDYWQAQVQNLQSASSQRRGGIALANWNHDYPT